MGRGENPNHESSAAAALLRWSRTTPAFLRWSRTVPVPLRWSRTIPGLLRWSRAVPAPLQWSHTIPAFLRWSHTTPAFLWWSHNTRAPQGCSLLPRCPAPQRVQGDPRRHHRQQRSVLHARSCVQHGNC